MSVTVSDAGPYEKLVSFNISEAELDTAKSKAARRLSKDLKIRGFRPGKAPRPIVEATVGAETLRREAIEEILPAKVGDILRDTEIEPAATPSLQSMADAESGIDVEVKVAVWPVLDEVPEHHDRRITVGSPEVTAEELQAQINRIRDQFAGLETVERPAEEGDYVAIDITAERDGEAVEEASASQLLYEVGSGGFIEGIDAVLVGHSAGDSLTHAAPLPEGFGDRSGLEVVFTVTVTEVREKVLPDLTDSWVDEVTEFETVQELRDALLVEMSELKKRSLMVQFRDRAINELVDQIEIEFPAALISQEMDEVMHRFMHRLEAEEIELADYFRATGISQEDFVSDLRSQADRNIRTRLLLEGVANQDGIEVTRDELDQVIEAAAAQSEQPDQVRELFKDGLREKSLVSDILRNKAFEAIVAGATPVDDEGNPVDLEIAEPEGIVEGDVVEAEPGVVEAEVVEAEVVAGWTGEEE